MDEQISINDFLREQEPIKYGERSCRACKWYRFTIGRCKWAIDKDRAYKPKVDYYYPSCDGDCHFEPNEYVIKGMCASCEYCNQFEYETKPEYDEELRKHNGYTTRSAKDPLETPNIYCDHPQGSLNRRTEYKDVEWPGFGVGHWDRQHEWDTCDRWKLDQGPYSERFCKIAEDLRRKDGQRKESNGYS